MTKKNKYCKDELRFQLLKFGDLAKIKEIALKKGMKANDFARHVLYQALFCELKCISEEKELK